MAIEPMAADGTIRLRPIGTIRSGVRAQQTGGFEAVESRIELLPEFEEWLLGLDGYSHVKVLFWMSEQTEAHGVHRPQGNPHVPDVGMFACR